MEYNFDWTGLTQEALKLANSSKEEDFIVASVPVVVKRGPSEKEDYFIVDVHHENYPGEGRRFDLEMYTSNEEGRHLHWIMSNKSIKSATHYARFCRRAEQLIIDSIFGVSPTNGNVLDK